MQKSNFFYFLEYLLEKYFIKSMANNKNVVEEALFQIRNLEETLQENAKGILHSTMSEEIRQLVKESLKEEDEEVSDEDMATDDEDMTMDDEDMTMDDEDMTMDDEDMEMDDEEEVDMDDKEMSMDDEEVDMDDEDMEMDDETIDMTGASDEEVLRVFKAMGDEDGIIVKKEGENIRLTDGDNEYMIHLGESEENIDDTSDELEEWSWGGAAKGAIMGGLGLGEEDEVEDGLEDEIVYEIEMDDEDISMEDEDIFMEDEDEDLDFEAVMESKKAKKSTTPKGVGIGKGPKFGYDKKPNMNGGFNEKRKEAFGKGTKATGTGKAKFEYKDGENMEKGSMKKVETKEASRTYGNGSKNGSRGLRKSRVNNRNMEFNPFKLSEGRLHEEVEILREKNEEYKKALDVFRTKLNEVAVFNSNLAYATRLFTEHSTTKQEKINILKRFDNVESLKESKNLYRTIKTELNSDSNVENKINESIERTVKTVSTGSAVNLIESKTYENPQFMRMKDLMTKLK